VHVDYGRGAFTSDLDAWTCNLFDGLPKTFDQDAIADHARVADAIRGTAWDVHLVYEVTYDEQGQLASAEFHLDAGGFKRWSYLFDRLGAVPKVDEEGEVVHEPITDVWWFVEEDWN